MAAVMARVAGFVPGGWLRADGHRGITRHNPAYTVDNMSGIATVTAT